VNGQAGKVWLRFFLALAVMFLWMPAATRATEAQPQTANSAEAVQWLQRLGPAMNMTSYRGVFVYGRGQQVHSMQVAHRYNGSMVEERLVIQDGGSGEIVRRDMEVVCVLPARDTVTLDSIIPSGPLADSFSDQLLPATLWYQAQMLGEGRVAGYAVVKIALNANDPYRYSYRLWLEKDTGLLVKSQTRNADDQILEHFQFTSLDITDDIADSELQIATADKHQAGTFSLESGSPATELVTRLQGWSLDWLPAGFEPAATPRSDKRQVIAFSDGLAAFSVFVEDIASLDMPTGASRIGATTVYLRPVQSDGRQVLISVVGEVPPITARKVAESVRFDGATVDSSSGDSANVDNGTSSLIERQGASR
jgi:sigma-E factor negative regulatory protein RseB